MLLTGAQILVKTLIEQGADVVFGYPGGAVLNIYDALYEYKKEIRHVLTCHEQGAAHAADGYARSTGKTGVVIATSGPGATNLVTGIAAAYMDSVPVVAITCNVALDLIGRDSFQEIDIAGITMPITKHNYIVSDVNDLSRIVREAFSIAASGRPGPVLVDIPKDITAKTALYEPQSPAPLRPLPLPSAKVIEEAAALIESSSRPLVYAGGGVVSSGASPELAEFIDKINAPVSLSIMGISALPQNHPRNLGMIGMHGTPVSNHAAAGCDLLIAVGARFSDRVAGDRRRFAKGAKVIHIDADPSEQGKNVRCDLSIVGDAREVLKALTRAVKEKTNSEWIHELMAHKVKNPMPVDIGEKALGPRYILSELSRAAGKDAIIVTDVGQHQMFTAQYYPFKKPRTFISSCGLGAMGYGMGAAIGAKVANPERPVALVTGDGSFHMNMNELACAVSEKLPIVIVLMDNGVLGMVRQWQKFFYNGRYSNSTPERKTDYAAFARALGAHGISVRDKSELAPALKEAFTMGGPCIIHCPTDRDNHVFPLIPPGGNEKSMIFCD